MPIFGKNQQINCSDTEYYKFLGYVANHPHDINIVWENNEQQGAWGSEGRIQFFSNFVVQHFPVGIGFSAGVINSSIKHRLNCNELFQEMQRLGFNSGSTQNLNTIRNNIPTQYQADFDLGSNL